MCVRVLGPNNLVFSPVLVSEEELSVDTLVQAIAAEAVKSGKREVTSRVGLVVYRLSFESGYLFVAVHSGRMGGATISLNIKQKVRAGARTHLMNPWFKPLGLRCRSVSRS
jgi:hypothetical protein